jgi:hypothetical protein
MTFGLRLRAVIAALPQLARTVPTWRRIARISRIVNRRHGAFRAYRVVELLFYYQRYVQLFASHAFQMAVISSHSNPHGIALNLAARRFGVPVVLITHGMPISPIARLDYDLAIMECDASVDVYRRAGCRLGQVLVKSRQRDYVPMANDRSTDDRLTIGIFLSKDPVEHRFVSLVHALLADGSVSRVLVRRHPVSLWPGVARCIASFGDARVCLRESGSLAEDVRECHFVMAANSTVHVDAVVAGTPSCYVRDLDHAPYDVQSFVRAGLIFELDPSRRFVPGDVLSFYARDEWPAILRQYANVDCDEARLAPMVTSAIRTLSAQGQR